MLVNYQVDGIEDLHLPDGARTRIRQKTILTVDAETAEASRIWRSVPNIVQHFHVPNVVDIE